MNVLVSCLLTDYTYPFFKYNTKPNPITYTREWLESVVRSNLDAIVLIDEPQLDLVQKYQSDKIKFHHVKSNGLNQMDYRWQLLYDFINSPKQNRIDNLFIMDIADTTILKSPFDFINQSNIYVGDEETNVGIGWMSSRVELIDQEKCYQNFDLIKDKKLLNCGLLGGSRVNVLSVLKRVNENLKLYNVTNDTVDMIAFNEVLYLEFSDKIIHGKPINTEFWKWERGNKECFFQHK